MNSIRLLANSLDSFYSKDEDAASSEDPLLLATDSSTTDPATTDENPATTNDLNLDSRSNFGHDTPKDQSQLLKDDNAQPAEADSQQDIFPLTQDHLWSIIGVLYFIPYHLIVRPLMVFWLVITYPVTYTLEQLGISGEKRITVITDFEEKPFIPGEEEEEEEEEDLRETSSLTSRQTTQHASPPFTPLPKHDEDVMDENHGYNTKTEILKQETIISNDIKSPTTCGKYIIPPPQRLYPLSRNPNKVRKKKTLILDLDETLIHSLSRGSPRQLRASSASPAKTIEIRHHNLLCLYYVYKRPYCDYFLQEASKWFDLQIFTASVKEYADPIVDWLENDLIDHRAPDARRLFTQRYYRHDCTFKKNVGYIKDLSRFFSREDELKNVVLLDNSPISYALHHNNGIMIEGWINDHSDRELLHILPMLQSLSLCIDVRYILGMKQGESVFES